MNSPQPRLKKLPFIVTGLTCFAVFLLIGLLAENRFSPLPLITAVTFLGLSITAFMFPVISDYSADCQEATERLRNELEQQIARVQAASESLARAASHIKAIEEAVHKSARDAETLPYRMAEKLAEFNESLAEKEADDRAALELELEELRSVNSGNLKTVADKIQKATAEWAALETSTRKQLTHAQEVAAKIDTQLNNTLAQIALQATLTPAAPSAAAPVPPAAPAPATALVPTLPAATPVAAEPAAAPTVPVETAAPLAPDITVAPFAAAPNPEPAKAKKPRPPRKPKPEDILTAMSESSAPAEPAEPVAVEPVRVEESNSPSDDSSDDGIISSSTSSDGATRLLTTAYIGIGNKLFIRGDGPGLSWDKGVPMQFVSIGKWGWATQEAVSPIRVKLLKNDEAAALTGDLTLEPGRHTEITALF